MGSQAYPKPTRHESLFPEIIAVNITTSWPPATVFRKNYWCYPLGTTLANRNYLNIEWREIGSES
jgi:hypothetical protein